MGDLIRGETFHAGETVTAERLHRHVEEATIKTGAVTTAHLADESVTAAKLAADVSIQASSVQLTKDLLLVGNDSNVGVGVPASASFTVKPTFKINDGAITTALLANEAVDTSKLDDEAVTAAKLAIIAGLPTTPQGSTSLVPVVTVNDRGQVTALSTVGLGIGMGLKTLGEAIPAVRGKVVFVLPDDVKGIDPPDLIGLWLKCIADDPGVQRVIGDRVPLGDVNRGGHCFSSHITKTEVTVMRHHDAENIKVCLLTGASAGEERVITAANWHIVLTMRANSQTPLPPP